MKKLFALLTIIAFTITYSANAQESKSKMSDQKSEKMSDKKSDKMSGKMELKDHVCTAACKDGKHAYMHGEKGHVCTAECKKMEKEGMKMDKMKDDKMKDGKMEEGKMEEKGKM